MRPASDTRRWQGLFLYETKLPKTADLLGEAVADYYCCCRPVIGERLREVLGRLVAEQVGLARPPLVADEVDRPLTDASPGSRSLLLDPDQLRISYTHKVVLHIGDFRRPVSHSPSAAVIAHAALSELVFVRIL